MKLLVTALVFWFPCSLLYAEEEEKSANEHVKDAVINMGCAALLMGGAAASIETGNVGMALISAGLSGERASEAINDLKSAYKEYTKEQEGRESFTGDRDYESKQNDRDSDLR